MIILEKTLLYSPDIPYAEPYMKKVGEADIFKIQVSGQETCAINIYGRLSPLMDYQSLIAIKDSDYSFVNMITTAGIYTVPCEGYNELKMEVTTQGEGMSCYIVRGVSVDD